MLVGPADVLTVSEVFNLTRFGELMLSEGGLLVQPTELADAGSAEATAIAIANEQRRVVLDDGTNASRSAINRPYLSPDTPVRVGDELDFTSPLVLGFGFGNWRFQPADGTPKERAAEHQARGTRPGRRRRADRRVQRPELLPDPGGGRRPWCGDDGGVREAGRQDRDGDRDPRCRRRDA